MDGARSPSIIWATGASSMVYWPLGLTDMVIGPSLKKTQLSISLRSTSKLMYPSLSSCLPFSISQKDAEIKDDNGESPVHNEARAYFSRMEQGDTSALALWREFRDLSIEKYKEIYHRLNIAFDIYSGESQFSLASMEKVIQELRDSGLLVLNDGAQVVELGKTLGNAIVCKSDGSMLYLSRDIAAAMQRYEEYAFDKMFYVVANQQTHHFQQVCALVHGWV